MAKTASTTSLKLTLKIPESLYDTFAERAAKSGRTAETEILRHLEYTQTYCSGFPIYLGDDERNELSTLAGRSMLTPQDVLEWARKVAALEIGDVSITLPLVLAGRLASRKFGKAWVPYLRDTVIECLEERTGMR
jgi:hypothetical protein